MITVNLITVKQILVSVVVALIMAKIITEAQIEQARKDKMLLTMFVKAIILPSIFHVFGGSIKDAMRYLETTLKMHSTRVGYKKIMESTDLKMVMYKIFPANRKKTLFPTKIALLFDEDGTVVGYAGLSIMPKNDADKLLMNAYSIFVKEREKDSISEMATNNNVRGFMVREGDTDTLLGVVSDRNKKAGVISVVLGTETTLDVATREFLCGTRILYI